MKKEVESTDELEGFPSPPAYSDDIAPIDCDSQEPEKTDEPKQDLPINVLVIGETQNGKSTMIRQMGVYAGVPDINVKIGFGMRKTLQPNDEFCSANYSR